MSNEREKALIPGNFKLGEVHFLQFSLETIKIIKNL